MERANAIAFTFRLHYNSVTALAAVIDAASAVTCQSTTRLSSSPKLIGTGTGTGEANVKINACDCHFDRYTINRAFSRVKLSQQQQQQQQQCALATRQCQSETFQLNVR